MFVRKPLAYVSPSSAEVLRVCFLRFALSQQEQGTLKGPYIRLGFVVHETIAKCSKKFAEDADADRESTFEQIWENAVARQEAAMDSAFERHFGVLSRWRTYETTRSHVKHMLISQPINSSAEESVEKELSALGGKLRGRPDRIVRYAGKLVVEDFKAGSIYELGDGNLGELRPSYRRQILVYGYLASENYGEWPSVGRVISIGGELEQFDIDPAAAEKTAHECVVLLEEFNAAIASGDEDSLASPSESACANCDHQRSCEPFWRAARQSWARFASVEGEVLGMQEAPNGLLALRIAPRRGTLDQSQVIIGKIDPVQFPAAREFTVGQTLRLTNLRMTGSSGVPGWFSTIEPASNSR